MDKAMWVMGCERVIERARHNQHASSEMKRGRMDNEQIIQYNVQHISMHAQRLCGKGRQAMEIKHQPSAITYFGP